MDNEAWERNEAYEAGFNDGYNNGYDEGFQNANNNLLEKISRRLGCIVFMLAVPFIISAIFIFGAITTGISIFEILSRL